jgi:4-oxalocrotonate tautomerase
MYRLAPDSAGLVSATRDRHGQGAPDLAGSMRAATNRFLAAKGATTAMPMIRVEMYSGRTLEQKRAIARALTDALCATADCAPQSVQVILCDVDKSDWASAGVLAVDK